jgi:transcriptional regulator with XRE-family HTH domain
MKICHYYFMMNAPQVSNDVDVGRTLRDLRKGLGITLQALAAGIGRSVGFVSQIERGLSRPTVEDITLIAGYLKVPSAALFGRLEAAGHADEGPVTRAGQRLCLRYERGVTDHLASPRLSDGLCLLETTLAPGADTGEGPVTDSQQQGGYVLQGRIVLTVDGTEWTLEAGDAFQLGARQGCRLFNPGAETARLLWILTH